MKNRFNPLLGTFAVIAMTQSAYSADATWNGTTDAVWATGTNWSATPVPGTGNTATFNNAGGAVDTIDLGAGVTVNSLIFDTSSVAAYTIGSGAVASQSLTLNNGGSITANSTINANQIFNAKLVLGTDATTQSYSITNNDTSNLLTFAGGITGGTGGTAGAKTLNIAAAAGTGAGITLSGAITNGGASSLGLSFSSVSGNVGITLSGGVGNTYTGGTSVGSGVRVSVSANSLGGGAISISSGGQLWLNSAGTYSNNFTLNGTGTDALGALRIGTGAANTINGSVTLGSNSRIAVDSGRTGTINGLLSGAFALEKVSAGTLTLGGANSSIGNLTITAGSVLTENNMTFGNVSVAGTFNLGSQSAAYTVNINGLSGVGSLTTANSGGFTRTLNVGNADATSDFSGVITKSGNRGLTLNKVGTGTLTLSGTGANVDGGGTGSFATNVNAGILNLNKTGVVALPGATVAVNGGTLKISGTGGNQIADTTVLTLARGTIDLAAAGQTETIASTTLSAGASSVTQSQAGSVLNMNTITRSPGGTINFSAGGIATTDNNNSTNGILGGWATVAGTDWASSVDTGAADTPVTAYAGYTNDTWAAANNVTVTTNSSQASGSTANSLRFNAAAANTVTLAGTNVLTTGGILVTSNVGNNLSTITGGTLAGSASGELFVNQNNSANALTIQSQIVNNTGATGLTKSGAGVLILSSANAYTGATTVNAGTLRLGVNSAINTTSGLGLASGAVLDLNNFNTTAGALSGAGSVTNNAAGTATATLTITNGTSWTGSIVDGATAKVAVTVNSGGQATLGGSNTFTGGLILGTSGNTGLAFASGNSLGNGLIDVRNNSSLRLSDGQTVTGKTISIQGTGGSASGGANGNGALNLVSGIATWAGDVKSGSGTTSGRIGVTGTGTLTISGNISNNTGTSGAGLDVVFNSDSTLGSGIVILSGTNNTYTGATIVGRGVLKIGANNVLPTGSILQVGTGGSVGARFDLNGYNQTVGGLQRTSVNALEASVLNDGGTDSTLTISTESTTDASYNGVIKDGITNKLSLTKSGTGSQTLTATSTYTGGTLVNEGTLVVNGNISTSISTTVATGAKLAGSGTVGAATISGILAPGNSIGTITATGDVTWNDNDAWVFELGSSASTLALAGSGTSIQDMLNITGAGSDFLKGTGSSFTFDFSNTGAVGFYKLVDWTGTTTFSSLDFLATNLSPGLTGSFTVDGTTSALYLNVVPEPDAAALLGSLGILALLRRRRS